MDREQLQQQVEEARDVKWIDAQIKKMIRVPGKARDELRSIVDHERDGYRHIEDDDRQKRAVKYFAKIDEKQRLKLWVSLFPKMASHIEQAWQTAGDRPYQQGYIRFPFRSPDRAESIDANRARFFLSMCDSLAGYKEGIEWVAAWSQHLKIYSNEPRAHIGWLLATVLRQGGDDADRVRSVLVDSINGDHEVGDMGHHVISAMLNSDQRDDWEVIAKLLLAAQRQEGLRQSILEAIDEANPEAFQYMLGVIREHDLGRFSATVRAFDAWLGMQWAGGSGKVVHDGVDSLCLYLGDEKARLHAIESAEPSEAFLALWVSAYLDAQEAVKQAELMLVHQCPERRFVAVKMFEHLALLPESIEKIITRLLAQEENDERVLMAMASFIARIQFTSVTPELFESMGNLFNSMPKRKQKLEPIVWPWAKYEYDRRVVASALKAMASGSPDQMIPYMHALDSWDVVNLIEHLAGTGHDWINGKTVKRKPRNLSVQARSAVAQLTCDSRQDVQKAAFKAIERLPVEQDEVELLMSNLHRTAASLRQGAISRLSKLKDPEVIKIIGTLLEDKNAKKRAAGLELASHLIESKRSSKKVQAAVRSFADFFTDKDQKESVDRILGKALETVSLSDCLGLVRMGSRCSTIKPKFVGVRIETPAAKKCLKEIADLFVLHGETEVELEEGEFGDQGKSVELLSSAGWKFPKPKAIENHREEAVGRLPLCNVWLDWLDARSMETRDSDGLELVRAMAWIHRGESYRKHLPKPFQKEYTWQLRYGFERLVSWLMVISKPQGAGTKLVQYFEDSLARDSMSDQEKVDLREDRGYREPGFVSKRASVLASFRTDHNHLFTKNDNIQLGALKMLALDRDEPDCYGPTVEEFVVAYDKGLVNDRDMVWHMLHPRVQPKHEGYAYGPSVVLGPIKELTGLKTHKAIGDKAGLIRTVDEMRDRIISLELTRGEMLTSASHPAALLRFSGGAKVFFDFAVALGKDKIVRQDQWGDPTRAYSFSRLISVTNPIEADSPELFARLYQSSGLKEARLLELVMFAPQWAPHAEQTLGLDGLEEAVWWIHAHTKKNDYWRNQDFREIWAAQINERTELDSDDLEEGAVDVRWFTRVIELVGDDGWTKLQKPAKYASNSGGHKRAQLFADAMLNRLDGDELLSRINDKRHQDAVRALGLIPLSKKKSEAKIEMLVRYKQIQEFKRESRKFGSQRQASEGKSVAIAMQNLARTAGFRDPRRLQWAMESQAVTDLAKGPVVVTIEETSVSLAITEAGEPELAVMKKGKKLKNVPAKLRKNDEIAPLRSRVTELRRQRSRMRISLEESMCRGDEFSRSELKEFAAHPILKPMIERLVFIGNGQLIGYPEQSGQLLRNHNGTLEPIGNSDKLRLAHPTDLLKAGDWSEWQRDCFKAERIQPFKQVFREVYPKTKSELDQCDMPPRYAGHQVNPRQALSLLKQRQWIHSPEEGVRKVYHDEKIIAELWFQEHFYTPAEVEGLTLEGVAFISKEKKEERVTVNEIPDRIFSEAIRDLDLVVSVAHAGGVDPEASASTVEMRASLLRETCMLLGLNNVQVKDHHAIIDGTRATYSVHLGSASTSVLPGKAMFIVAVHSQHRGRIFLPFADSDPKSAEVLSKVLLLARDDEIKDPHILDQIRA